MIATAEIIGAKIHLANFNVWVDRLTKEISEIGDLPTRSWEVHHEEWLDLDKLNAVDSELDERMQKIGLCRSLAEKILLAAEFMKNHAYLTSLAIVSTQKKEYPNQELQRSAAEVQCKNQNLRLANIRSIVKLLDILRSDTWNQQKRIDRTAQNIRASLYASTRRYGRQ